MKHHNVSNPGLPGVARLLLGAVLLLFVTTGAQATPVLSGDIDLIVTVDPMTDCVGCTPTELDVLERGVGMMLTEMHNTFEGAVCVAEASLAKDLALVTFDAYRAGAVSENRWRDGLRYKGRFAASLTQATIDTMLRAYREAIEERLGIQIMEGSLEALQIDIYASAQLSRLFDRMGGGYWQNTWLPAMEEPTVGFNYVVDGVVGQRWTSRRVFDEILIYSRVDAHWRDAELARITGLQPDFLVGTVEADRDQLYDDYRAAMVADPSTTMAWGCAPQAAEGFRRHALELTQGITFIAAQVYKQQQGDNVGDGPNVFQDDQGPVGQIQPFPDSPGTNSANNGDDRGWFPGYDANNPPTPTQPPGDDHGFTWPTGSFDVDSFDWDDWRLDACNPEFQDCDGKPRCYEDGVLLGADCHQINPTCNDLVAGAAAAALFSGFTGNAPAIAVFGVGAIGINWLCNELGPGGRL